MKARFKIGFDAKRAFHNHTGLGNYSRQLVQGLSQHYPTDELFLFNPKQGEAFDRKPPFAKEIRPTGFSRFFSSVWRSQGMIHEIETLELDIYHGLSHELPQGIEQIKTSSVVTMHDLIFEHYPSQYAKSDLFIYRKKFKQAALHANVIIAISEATKLDLMNFYGVSESKITVGSTSIDPRFWHDFSQMDVECLRAKYSLPQKYFISVGSIIERKNLLRVCEAFARLKDKTVGLVIIGKGKEYKTQVKNFLSKTNLVDRVCFLEDKFSGSQIHSDLPGLLHASLGLIYPSIKEGFGMPVVEAMATKCPAITSNLSSLLEAGGDAAILVNPFEVDEIENAMIQLLKEETIRLRCIEKGILHAQKYTVQVASNFVHEVYETLIKK